MRELKPPSANRFPRIAACPEGVPAILPTASSLGHRSWLGGYRLKTGAKAAHPRPRNGPRQCSALPSSRGRKPTYEEFAHVASCLVGELRPGVWYWQSPHPDWNEEQSWWPELVSSYAIELGDEFALFDPLSVPGELRERATAVVLTAISRA